jgi:hypothetical protein
MKTRTLLPRIAALSLACAAFPAFSEDKSQDEELARSLANPVASLISVPLQYNYDENLGPGNAGSLSRLNIQPVIPFAFNEDWNLITRTIVPLMELNDVPVRGRSESGLGDTVASQFLSPARPGQSGWIWGAGPVWLLPTATDDLLGTGKWGVGPTAVALRQEGRLTAGILFNHIWSFAGDSDRSHVNATLLQPFVAYILPTMTTIGMNTESTYDWSDDAWAVPVNVTVAQLLKVRGQIFQVQVGARYWLESTEQGAEDWGIRATLTFLFPK